MSKILYFYNKYGLGDSVFNMIFFTIIKHFIFHNSITIYYYTKSEYITQLQEFINNYKNIILGSFDTKPPNSIELWIDNDSLGYTFSEKANKIQIVNYNKYYKNFFNIILKKLNININISKFVYKDEDLLNRYNFISDKYKHFDILILNSIPNSGQYNYVKNTWDNFILKLNNKFNILTTNKVKGVLCTYDDKLTIKDIASLSTKAKIVIAINSGVLPGLLNIYTLKTVRHFYIFDDRCYYSYPNFENKKFITDITFEELEQYLK